MNSTPPSAPGNLQSTQPRVQQPDPAHTSQFQPVQQVSQRISTETVQQFLDENEALITAIVDNINANRAKDCAQYQARLQQNLMYLAAIADQNSAPQTK